MTQEPSDILRISFQDPDGFVFTLNNKIYRLVLSTYTEDLILLKNFGILDHPQLVRHKETDINSFPPAVKAWLYDQIKTETLLTVFELDKIEFISYPWEWTPSMLQDAALLTLDFQSYLMEKGFTLKDASFYNIQFINGSPVFIDLLSIKIAGDKLYPWFAYGQFLQHFIFPLIIIKYKNFDSLQFLQAYPNGFTKTEVANLVPVSSYFSFFELFHIHLFKHLNREENNNTVRPDIAADKQKLQLQQLISFAAGYLKKQLKHQKQDTAHWVNYYAANTTFDYTEEKEKIFVKLLEGLGTVTKAVDLGANTGFYSEILLKYTPHLLSLEQDNTCCEIIRNKMKAQKRADNQWQIICSNLLYPSPAIGWLNRERKALIERLQSPLIVALALIHHFYFSGSIGFIQIAELFRSITTQYVIVEFIDKEDNKVILLSQKNDTRLSSYSREGFIDAMSQYFLLSQTNKLSATRDLFLFTKKI